MSNVLGRVLHFILRTCMKIKVSGPVVGLHKTRSKNGLRFVFGQAYRGLTGGFLFFQCWCFCESSCLFYLRYNFYFCGSKIMHL